MSFPPAVGTGGTLARRVLTCAVVMAVSLAHVVVRATDEPGEIRGVALSAAAFDSADGPLRALRSAADGGFNTVFVPIALDKTGRVADADRINAIVNDAHARGLRVHASLKLIVAAAAGELPGSRDHVIYTHPEWLMVPRELAGTLYDLDPHNPEYLGRLARWTRANSGRADGLYLSPLQPDAVDYIAKAASDIIAAYAVDGIHLEGVRYPGSDFDYSRRSIEIFRDVARRIVEQTGSVRGFREEPADGTDLFASPPDVAREWQRFRTARLTALLARVHNVVRSIRPGAVVSADVEPGAERALTNYLQDWRTWLDSRFVDALSVRAGTATTLLYSYATLADEPVGGTDQRVAAPRPTTAGSP